jgi:hypothetical protein
MTKAIEAIIEKVKSATEKSYENEKYTIDGDDTAIEWLKHLTIVNRIRLFPNFYGTWAIYNNTNYLVLVNHESSPIPIFLEEETLNPGAWVAIVDELDLPLKQDIDKIVFVLKDFLGSSWDLDNEERKKIIFDQYVNDYRLTDFFPDIFLYKIISKFTRPEELHQILGLVLVKGTNCRLLPYSEDVTKQFEEIFDNGNKNIPFDNLLASYVASDFKFAYLDIYRCIERLQPLYYFKDFYKTLSLNDTSLLKFCEDFYLNTKLEPSLSNSLEKLFKSINEDDNSYSIKSQHFYKIRNQIVHLRPNQTNDLITKKDSEWNELILNILTIVKELYSQNKDLF